MYRQHSVKALGGVAKARSDIDMNETVVEIAESILKPDEADEDAMDVDVDKEEKRKTEEM